MKISFLKKNSFYRNQACEKGTGRSKWPEVTFGPGPSGAHGGTGTGWPVQTVLPARARALYTIARANAPGKKLMKKFIKKIIHFFESF